MYGRLKLTSFCVRDSSMNFGFFFCQSDSQSILGHPVQAVPWAVLYIFSVTDFCDNLGPITCPLHNRWCCTLVTKLAVSHTVLATPYYGKHIMLLPGGQFSTRIAINALLSLLCSIVFGSSYPLFTINSLSPFLPQAWGEPAPLWNHGQNLKIPLHCF